jgi:hypothetical protein
MMDHICTPTEFCENQPCPLDEAIAEEWRHAPKHRADRPVDAHSRALIYPPMHPVGTTPETFIVAGKHRDFGTNTGTIVETILRRYPLERMTERGSAQWQAAAVLSGFAMFLFLLTIVLK